MTGRSFREKPSESHIVWTRETRAGASKKRLDVERFEQWATHHGFDFETAVRVDHDRCDEPRTQYRCVFAWGTVEAETIEFGDEEWSMGDQTTPRTFLELDSEGLARVKGWNDERTLDVAGMRHDGRTLVIETGAGDRKRLDAGSLASDPGEHDGSCQS